MGAFKRYSSTDSENMREKKYNNLFTAGCSVKNVSRWWRQYASFSPVDFSKIGKNTSKIKKSLLKILFYAFLHVYHQFLRPREVNYSQSEKFARLDIALAQHLRGTFLTLRPGVNKFVKFVSRIFSKSVLPYLLESLIFATCLRGL
jgi:hypothetical protein